MEPSQFTITVSKVTLPVLMAKNKHDTKDQIIWIWICWTPTCQKDDSAREKKTSGNAEHN
jgi:hypothetical protein